MSTDVDSIRRSNLERGRDLEIIGDLFLKGWGITRIQEELNKNPDRRSPIKYKDIDTDIRYLRAQWRENALTSVGQHKSEEVIKFNNLEAQYWNHYERTDDIRALAGVANCIVERARIVGLYSQEATQTNNVQVVFSWSGSSDTSSDTSDPPSIESSDHRTIIGSSDPSGTSE